MQGYDEPYNEDLERDELIDKLEKATAERQAWCNKAMEAANDRLNWQNRATQLQKEFDTMVGNDFRQGEIIATQNKRIAELNKLVIAAYHEGNSRHAWDNDPNRNNQNVLAPLTLEEFKIANNIPNEY